eukprot:20712_1
MADFQDEDVELDYGDDPIPMDTEDSKGKQMKKKGRGLRSGDGRAFGRGGKFDSLSESRSGAAKSVEGWVVVITGIHEEAQEDDIYERFAEHGDVSQIHLNLDRRTGFVKGYGLVEYKSYEDAERAVSNENGEKLLGMKLGVAFAFSKHGIKSRRRG